MLLRPTLQELRLTLAAEIAAGSTAGRCSSAVSALAELLWLKSTALLEGTPFQRSGIQGLFNMGDNGPASTPTQVTSEAPSAV